jgi:hypothetical protein
MRKDGDERLRGLGVAVDLHTIRSDRLGERPAAEHDRAQRVTVHT